MSSNLLKLPPEILEEIISAAVPVGADRYWTSISVPPKAVTDWFINWKETCIAIRSTCKLFSEFQALKKALFHTFNWLPTPTTLNRLDSITAHFPELVQTMTFHPPLFGYGTASPGPEGVRRGVESDPDCDEEIWEELADAMQVAHRI